jgi:hypothetical protein
MTTSYMTSDGERVNQTIEGIQENSAVAQLADGGWVVTWRSDGSVYATMYDQNGTVVAAEINVSQGEQVPSGTPVVTGLANGGFAVAWTTADSAGLGITYATVDSSGTVAISATESYANDADTVGDQTNPSITGLTGGGWVISWQSPSGTDGSLEIHHQVFDASGSEIIEAQVNTTTTGDQFDSMVVALPDGGFMETWTSDSGSSTTIYRREYDADGNTSGSDVYIDGTGGGTETKLVDPSYVTLTNGSSVEGFLYDTSSGDMYIAEIRTFAGAFLTSVYIGASNGITSSDIVALDDGNFAVAWSTTENDTAISYARIYDSSGEAVSDVITLADGQAADSVKIAALDDGSFVVTYTLHGDSYDIYQQIVAPNEAPVTEDFTATISEDHSYTFALADFSFTDGDSDTFTGVQITQLPETGNLKLNGSAVESGQTIAASDIGNLVWTPAENENGGSAESLKFVVHDSAGNQSTEHTVTFDITAVNDLPTTAASVLQTLEDAAYTFSTADFSFSDVDGGELAGIKITALGSGTLLLDGEAVHANDVITAANISHLTWQAAANANGDDLSALSFKVIDADGGVSAASSTVTFDVTAVEDVPSAINDTGKLTEGKTGRFNVLSNDTDVDGDRLSVVSAFVTNGMSKAADVNGTVTIGNDGKLVVNYTGDDLDPGEKAVITIRYGVSDGDSTDYATLRVSVTGVAEPGDDIIGTQGKDKLTGTNVAEFIDGLDGNDTINGRDGNDRIYGRGGRDVINGGTGDDIINGGKGKDRIVGATGNDTLTGDHGSDTFVFAKGDGHDTITDFVTTGKAKDVIDLSDFDLTFKQLSALMEQDDKDVVIDLGHKTEITLDDVKLHELSEANFAL